MSIDHDSPQHRPNSRLLNRLLSHRWHRKSLTICTLLAIYLLGAYALIPLAWETAERHNRWLQSDWRITTTSDGHPGDPINVGLVGSEADVRRVMRAAGWYPADPLGIRSDLRIGVDSVLDRSYDKAPVSNLFLFGRKEDLAFEQPVGDSPRHRHHVRFWKTGKPSLDGRPMWVGSASFDERVGLSHSTGQITHHIAPDVDQERDHVMVTLRATQLLTDSYSIPGFHQVLHGFNGGGDPWHTNGTLVVGIITSGQ